MIDINCDLGEGYGNDRQIMTLINSCSIACGGHFGDKKTMKETMLLAIDNDVKLGAHPSYPDTVSFGRISMDISSQVVIDSVTRQLDDFFNLANDLRIQVHHIKPHGALYNDVYQLQKYWDAFYDLTKEYPFEKYYVLGNCVEHINIEEDIVCWQEGFADRRYNANMTLQSRNFSGALIQEFDAFTEHIDCILKEEKIICLDNIKRSIHFDTLCIHGDHHYNLDFLKYIKAFMNE